MGVCKEVGNAVCPAGGVPMCGCDGAQYLNECEATNKGTSIAFVGECKPTGDGTCGGIAGFECDQGQFCNYAIEDLCGATDKTGLCADLPGFCLPVSEPVCGCDNVTYDNECIANKAGVAVAAKGTCEGFQESCGGLLGFVCETGYFCDWAPENMCGAADALGTCVKIPLICLGTGDPVCGCDGKTYDQACHANAAGVSIASKGTCDAEGAPCGGLLGFVCEKGYFCDYEPADMCGADDGLGSCKAKPESCIPFEAEVCGCDGKDYVNSCAANAEGVSVAHEGTCF